MGAGRSTGGRVRSGSMNDALVQFLVELYQKQKDPKFERVVTLEFWDLLQKHEFGLRGKSTTPTCESTCEPTASGNEEAA